MRSFTLGLTAGLGTLTLLALLLFQSPEPYGQTTQLHFFRELMNSYTPLLTPLSSAFGAPSIGGGEGYGALPLIVWLASACVVGIFLKDPSKSAKSSFASAAIVLLTWITLAFVTAPTWGDTTRWASELDAITTELLIHRPVDLLSTFLLPPAASALTASFLSARKMLRAEIPEEDYILP